MSEGVSRPPKASSRISKSNEASTLDLVARVYRLNVTPDKRSSRYRASRYGRLSWGQRVRRLKLRFAVHHHKWHPRFR